MEIEKLKVPPAYQAVSTELQKHILSGALKPGEPLPSEIELAAKFGVNRSTVREGIRQLESEGLVRREGRKRLLVTVPHSADLAPRTTRALVMHEVTFHELWEVAMVLEPLAAQLAADAASDAQIAALKANLDATAAIVERGISPGKLDLEFHSLVSAAAANKVLLLSREPVGLLLYPAFETFQMQLPQAARRLVDAHREVVAGIERRDGAHAELWMRKHVADLKRGWELAGLSIDQRIEPGVTP
ncbi:GntR family transcriptional regulator [Aliihoeflea sp. 2WW]|uniref:FadR/GntR family transcriptional regulator n=1 Tax=Aliihoeflea sp. 2WW TaxID=1381123 RepID=UPI000463D8EA|nr:GntR family transcriptional regulator [Aliihoeflea sp. 2WW]